MKITFYGTGYVGLVSGACLAQSGHEVLCVDIDIAKIKKLQAGMIPIYEPGLEEIITDNIQKKRLSFTTDIKQGIEHGLFQFITVNTPTGADGQADISNILKVAKEIGQHLTEYKLIIIKSTAPVGTAQKIKNQIRTILAERNSNIDFDVACNPEFLKEGTAVHDLMHPDRIIVGVENFRAEQYLRELYKPFNLSESKHPSAQECPFLVMDFVSAELTKYAANAMLATRISFINDLANIAERVGADIDLIRSGIGMDPRIGPYFLMPGTGYGGSCFPKDVKALITIARQIETPSYLLEAVEMVNTHQKKRLFKKIYRHYRGHLRDKTLAIWGLAFKPNTNDIREASSLVLLQNLWQHGVYTKTYDPAAMSEVQKDYGSQPLLTLCSTKEACLEQADALVICTEWEEFRNPDLHFLYHKLKKPVIFDGRNIFNRASLQELGFIYYGIGYEPTA